MTYKKKLEKAVKSAKSNLVTGLDTDLLKIPVCFLKYKNPVLAFNKRVIEATYENCAGYKLNLAFYEAAGIKGLKALEETLNYIPSDRITICDAKRGDIGNTAEMYARAYFDNMNFDAITLSPYMGYDSVSPFLERKDKFVYLLVRTSNKGADDFQNLKTGNKKLFEIVAEKSQKWSKDRIGYVIGANHTKEIKKYSSKNIPLLIPGIGAQGHDSEELKRNLKGNLHLINASRAVIYAGGKNDDVKVVLNKVSAACQELNISLHSRNR